MADVVPLCCIGRCYAFGIFYCHLMVWQMVATEVDVITSLLSKVADVIAIVMICGR